MDGLKMADLLKDKTIKLVSPAYKLTSVDILYKGKTPVISQDKEFIMGFTDKVDAKLSTPPFVVFGDHTECIKYVDFPFVQGADGIKILKVNDEGLDSRFLYYALLCCYNKTGFYERHFKLLKRTYIPCSGINLQKKIASILSTYDTLIENNTKRIHLLEQMAENLYKEWFVRFRFPGHENVEMENGLPKGWKVERIKECVKRLPFGKTYKANELQPEGNVIVIDQSTSDYLGYHNDEPSHYASSESPIILFGDHSCKFCLMTKSFSLGENIIPFKSKDTKEIDTYFLFFATHKLIVTEEYKRHWGRFSTMKILIPQIELQQSFAKLVNQFEQLKQKMIVQNQLLIRQRDLLLPRLMSGKLKVKP